jgi:hypothetical protein
VLNRFGGGAPTQAGQTEEQRAALPMKGAELAVGADAVRLPPSVGQVTTHKRPTSRF